jgi:hypothetical protein
MGYELYRMIRDGAPASWTPAMRQVAMVIADDARDPSQSPPGDGGWPRSAIPISGYWTRDGQWRDGFTERTGLRERQISRILTALARAGYEMRQQAGTDSRGRPLFAYPGHAMRFRVPILPPREPLPQATAGKTPDMATISTSDPATISTSDLATFDAGDPDHARYGDHMHDKSGTRLTNLARSTPDMASRFNPEPQDPHRQVVNSYLEGDRGRQPDDDDSGAQRQAGEHRARLAHPWDDRLGPGYGQCPDCGR